MSGSESQPNKYTLRLSSKFKKHLKRVTKRNPENARKIKEATDTLQKGEILPERYRDHALTGSHSDLFKK